MFKTWLLPPDGESNYQYQLSCSLVLSHLGYCNSLMIDITPDQMYWLQKRAAKGLSQYQTWTCNTAPQKAPLVTSRRNDHFLDSHRCILLLWRCPATDNYPPTYRLHFLSYSPFMFWWQSSFLCKMEAQGLRSLVIPILLLPFKEIIPSTSHSLIHTRTHSQATC